MTTTRTALTLAALLTFAIPAGALPLDIAPAAFDGTSKVVVIPLQFQDVKGVNSPLAIQNLFFGEGLNERSVRDYFDEVSGGAMKLGGVVVQQWVTSQFNMAQYGNSESFGRDPSFDPLFPPVAQCSIALEAARLADPFVDFSQFVDPATGTVRIVVIHAGTPQDAGTTDLDIWSHMWSICDENYNWGSFYFDGVRLDQYMTDSEFSPLGTNAHELGHLSLALPDLYLGADAVQDWDLMAGGSWGGNTASEPLDIQTTLPLGNDPSHLGPYFKSLFGWLTPVTVDPWAGATTFTLSPASQNSGIRAIKIPLENNICWTQRVTAPHQYTWSHTGSKYFLVEYRDPAAGAYDGGIGAPGVVTWYVDECAGGGGWWNMNADLTNPRLRVIQPSSAAMRTGDALSPLSSWSSTIDGWWTGLFVEVIAIGETATVRIGASPIDVRVFSPASTSSVTTARGTTSLPAAHANTDRTSVYADAGTTMTGDAPIQFRTDGPGMWTIQAYPMLDELTCTVLSTITCKLPQGTQPGEYVLKLRAQAGPGFAERRIDIPVRVVASPVG